MPEGHTIHREARIQSRTFVGQTLNVWSPQGRFSAGAEVLDGQTLASVEAWGKHLFYEWVDGQILHVHLGLFGRFRRFEGDPPGPSEGTRLAVAGDAGTQYLSGPTICELIDPDRRESIVATLGPDPLRADTHDGAIDHIAQRLARRTVPISAALLDQSVIAGLGNVYRSEILFRTALNPITKSAELELDQIRDIWDEALTQLAAGLRSGKIVTTDPEDVGRTRSSDIARGERTYVYKRQGESCRRCGVTIQCAEIASRKVWWCPNCQPP